MHTKVMPLVAAAAMTVALGASSVLAHDGRPGSRLPQLAAAKPGALVGTCEALAGSLGGLANTVITATTSIAAGTLMLAGAPVPAHCRVAGRMFDRVSPVDGKSYTINFEMRLPLAWNGRFWHQGNGGIDGAVVTAAGTFGGGPTTGALMQGFAVLSSDAGHTNAQGGPAFGIDPQARLDYGYQAVGKLTPMAKQTIAAAYGKGPDRSYFGGCSNGGRHTLVAAARYADEYDGYLAGAPGYNLPLAALANIFGAQRYATVVAPGADPATPAALGTAYTTAERATVSNAVLARCDALDGATDGMIQDTRACQRAFNFMRDVPTCAGARDGTCLSVEQKIAIAPIYRGATTSNGERFYTGFYFDAGLDTAGAASWEFAAPLQRDSGAVGQIFKVPPAPVAGFNDAAFILNLDIDVTLAQLFATDATYTESAMQFMTPPQATQLNDVRARGAKMLVYHGVSDQIFSVKDTEKWYLGVDHRSGGRAEDFVRLYDVPGMGHCSGGPATDQADFITPLVAWVEEGKAPRSVIASARGAGNAGGVNADLPAAWAANRTRPLCPYPSVATYKGRGDVESASSFECRAPRRHHHGHDDHDKD